MISKDIETAQPSRKPSLAFIHPFVFRFARGIERYVVNLGNALLHQGADVDILTWRWPTSIDWPEMDQALRIHRFPTPPYFAAKLMPAFYIHHLRKHRYDMLYLHFADYGESTTMNFLGRVSHSHPFSIVLHFPYDQAAHRYEHLKRTGLAAKATRLIAVSRYVGMLAESFFQSPCEVIHNGVDTEEFHPDQTVRAKVRAELSLPENSLILLTVAALEERKRVQNILRALPLVMAKVPNAYLVVLGDGPFRPMLESLIGELQISNHVRLLPAQSGITRFFQAADAFVFLAKGEAFSLATAEAMACQLPVVVARHPPYEEFVDTSNGILVDPGNIQGIADAAIRLLSQPSLGQKLGAQGRQRILQGYTWERAAHQYLSLLK